MQPEEIPVVDPKSKSLDVDHIDTEKSDEDSAISVTLFKMTTALAFSTVFAF